MHNSVIDIEHLNLYYGKQHILKDINISIPAKKITVILGPSGCGKTTLLRSLNRLTEMDASVKMSGKIFLNGQDLLSSKEDVTTIRKKMGLLAQRPYPLPMSIYNNVAYGLRISGRRKKKFLNNRVEYYLRQTNLWEEVKDRLKEPAATLSIGQQQRLCLARGLAVDPQIILADEPTSALDPHSSRMIEEKFAELKSNYTIVLVTHILRQARNIADHVIFMYMGQVVEQADARDFFDNPQEQQTKAYLQGQFY